jgi:hypothetical protein
MKKDFMTSEGALMLEAAMVIFLMYFFIGFELTVLSVLAVLTGHIFKMSRQIE